MKISTKGRYALRLMMDIAQHNSGEPVRAGDVAARQGISLKYLEQIISVLVRADFLQGLRGPQGGYRLVRKPEEYTVGSILRLTESALAPFEELELPPDDVTSRLWRELDEAIRAVLDRYTLEDLCSWNVEAADFFYI